MLVQKGTLVGIAGFALYIAGALCWVTRACYRQRHGRRYPTSEYRDDPKLSVDPIDNYQRSIALPEKLYEYLPFGYMFAGILSYQVYLHLAPSYLSVIATTLFTTAGLCIWMLRGYYRGYHRAHSPVLND
ncbi:MAG: hypothetical protein V7752_10200 [Halopseudomonas sp.]